MTLLRIVSRLLRPIALLSLVAAAFAVPAHAEGVKPLVSTAWLKQHLKNPDIVVLDVARRRLDVDLSAEEIAARLAAWTPPAARYQTGVLAKYAKLVSSASVGAVTG